MTACGVTAARIEGLYGPFDIPSCLADTRALRVHIMVDADNVCQDHVCFVAGSDDDMVSIYDSYIGVREPCSRVMSRQAFATAIQRVMQTCARSPGCRAGTRRNSAFNTAWQSACGISCPDEFIGTRAVEVHVTATNSPWRGWE